MNEFVNSDGQWLLSFYKIVTQLLTYSVTLVPPGQCAAKQPLTKTNTNENVNVILSFLPFISKQFD